MELTSPSQRAAPRSPSARAAAARSRLTGRPGRPTPSPALPRATRSTWSAWLERRDARCNEGTTSDIIISGVTDSSAVLEIVSYRGVSVPPMLAAGGGINVRACGVASGARRRLPPDYPLWNRMSDLPIPLKSRWRLHARPGRIGTMPLLTPACHLVTMLMSLIC